jgi:sec-independent protein translocase protein TatA
MTGGLFALFDISPVTLMILGVLAVLLFGDRLPEVARSVGKYLMEFKKGMRNIEQELHSVIYDATSTTTASSTSTPSITNDSQQSLNRDEATAPKFEPPPVATSADAASLASTSPSPEIAAQTAGATAVESKPA